jgi:hypothetical protein
MLVFILNEEVGLKLWISYLIVGGIVGAVAGFFIWRAVSKFEKFEPLDSTTEAIQENLEWKTTTRK